MCRRHLLLPLPCVGATSDKHRFALAFQVPGRILAARVCFAFPIGDFIESRDSAETSAAFSGCWLRVFEHTPCSSRCFLLSMAAMAGIANLKQPPTQSLNGVEGKKVLERFPQPGSVKIRLILQRRRIYTCSCWMISIIALAFASFKLIKIGINIVDEWDGTYKKTRLSILSEESHGRHEAVEIAVPPFPVAAVTFPLSLYQDPFLLP